MRKNSPRKWLHATLDLLPVILIPVFMIYSHRHTIDSGSIEIPQNEVVDFNQLVNITINSQEFNGIDYTIENNSIVIAEGLSTDRSNLQLNRIYNLDASHLYCFRGLPSNLDTNLSTCTIVYYDNNTYVGYNTFNTERVFNINSSSNAITIEIIGAVSGNLTIPQTIFTPQIFDLTQMFGVGNEPTYEEFISYYPNDYYDYTLSHKELLKGVSTITYSDTDIMSQFTYQLYNSVDKYFNMGNVFNMTSVYDWLNLNIFGGNAPISIYIVWNIVLYEFVMDLLFLLYGLFMWFIDVVEHIMDKPFKSIK